MTNPFHVEPVAVAAAIRLVLLAGMSFGLKLTPEQLTASMLAVEGVLAVFTRSVVSSKATVEAADARRAATQQKGP